MADQTMEIFPFAADQANSLQNKMGGKKQLYFVIQSNTKYHYIFIYEILFYC